MYEVAHYTEVNVLGTARLLDLLANNRHHTVRRIVLASSRSVYGEGPYHCTGCGLPRVTPGSRTAESLSASRWEPLCPTCGAPLVALASREDDAIRPASVYAMTKFTQEEQVRVSCEALGIDYAIFRLQNVYGEGQSLQNPYTGILSVFSTKIRHGAELPLFEDGLESRDFVHVSDVAEFLLRALDDPAPTAGVYNIGSGIPTSVAVVAETLARAYGVTPRTRVSKEYRLGDIRHGFADLTRLERRFGSRPSIDLEQGLTRFASWVLSEPIAEDRLERANRELRDRGLMSVAPR